MEMGEIREIRMGSCRGIYLIETGMYDVTGYGGAYIVDADRPAIVETGIGTHYHLIIDALHEIGIDPSTVEVIAVTHVHLDHAGGAGHLANACPNATVFAHNIGAPHLVDPDTLVRGTKAAVGDQWVHYREPRPVPDSRVEAIDGGDRISLGSAELIAHHAPGHAPHQVIFHVPGMDAIFTGDAAGIWVPERQRIYQTSPPPQFDLDEAIADLDTIANLEPESLLYTHFGPVSYTEDLLSLYEHTLATWVRDVDELFAEIRDEEAVISELQDRTDLDEIWGEEKARAEMRLNVRGVLTYLDRIRGED